MKKILITILAALCMFAAPLSALEWGGLFGDETKGSTYDFKDFAFKQSNNLFFWVTTPLNDAGTWSFSSEAMFKYNLDVADGTKAFTAIGDLDLLKVAGTIPLSSGKLMLSAGRFSYSDITGVNFSQCCDGAAANLSLKGINLGAYIGYTGLLNAFNVTTLDVLGPKDTSGKQFYVTSHSYLPAMLSVTLPPLVANQTLSLQGEAFIDLESTKYNRIYGSFVLSGPIAGTVFYSLASSFGFVKSDVMNYTSLAVSAFPTETMGINAAIEYASGNNGSFKPYVTFTSRPAYGSALSPETSGCLVPSIDFIYTTGSLFANVNAKVPFVMPEGKADFKGFGADLVFIYNIFSDLQAELDCSYFKDVATKGAEDSASVTLKCSLSF